MKSRKLGRFGFVLLAVAALGLPFLSAWGQGRVARQPAAAATEAKERILEIRKLSGLGRKGMVKTPEFRSNARASVTQPREWGEISVDYETYPEWIDSLAFEYFVMLLSPDSRKREYSFLKLGVRYVDIRAGRGHVSTVYLRPAAVERFGEPVGIAVEVSHEGKVVAELSDASDPGLQKIERWWRDARVVEAETVTAREGYLINRRESPFALIGIDDHEVIQ